VDAVRARTYAQNRDANIRHRVERLKRKSDRAKRVRRHDIPTGEGKLRPVGIPAVEDQWLQVAVARLLTAIYEQDCLRCRDG
jgi:RNA-directed DNA polymerase